MKALFYLNFDVERYYSIGYSDPCEYIFMSDKKGYKQKPNTWVIALSLHTKKAKVISTCTYFC